MSVTALAAPKRPFNAEVVSRRLSRLWKCSAKELLRRWSDATDKGTALHAAIDDYFNGRTPPATVTSTAEWTYFINFCRRHPTWRPYRVEWRIFCMRLLLAGTCDIIWQTPTGHFVLCDWKRIAKLSRSKLLCVRKQMHGYRYMLAPNYIPVSQMMVVLLHPNNQDYVEISIDFDVSLEEALVAIRRAQLDAAAAASHLAAQALRQAQAVVSTWELSHGIVHSRSSSSASSPTSSSSSSLSSASSASSSSFLSSQEQRCLQLKVGTCIARCPLRQRQPVRTPHPIRLLRHNQLVAVADDSGCQKRHQSVQECSCAATEAHGTAR
jgi:hypothetical protein